MKHYNSGPVSIAAKFDSLCAETGKPIKRGEQFVYWSGKAYHLESKHADEFRALEFASANCMADANW